MCTYPSCVYVHIHIHACKIEHMYVYTNTSTHPRRTIYFETMHCWNISIIILSALTYIATRDEAYHCVISIVSLWNLTGVFVSLLPVYLSNFRAIGKFYTRMSRLRDFTISCGKTSCCLVSGGPGSIYEVFIDNVWNCRLLSVWILLDAIRVFEVNRRARSLKIINQVDYRYVTECHARRRKQ